MKDYSKRLIHLSLKFMQLQNKQPLKPEGFWAHAKCSHTQPFCMFSFGRVGAYISSKTAMASLYMLLFTLL